MTTKEIIIKAYEFEIKAIEEGDTSENPFYKEILAMRNGEGIWECINALVEETFA